ncbi:MAG: hypothetical protein WBW85_02375 [Terriglobales bacterium]
MSELPREPGLQSGETGVIDAPGFITGPIFSIQVFSINLFHPMFFIPGADLAICLG